MAKYRQVHTHIWKDGWFLELEPIYKLFFIYLFTNERASISGIYELSKRVMSFESGLTYPEIDKAFEIFEIAQKAYYDDVVVFVVNLRKYHETKSPKVQTAITADVNAIKDCRLKGIYMERYGIDRVSDTLSIPRSSSSSSISSGFSSKNGHEIEIDTERDKHLGEYVNALASIVKETCAIGVNDDYFERVAGAVLDNGGTIEDIKAFSQWWNDNGDYQGRPYLKSFLQHFKESIEARKPNMIPEDWGSNAIRFEQ